jgi:ferric-dicitrate binding protein FerR (iron transport regulator)
MNEKYSDAEAHRIAQLIAGYLRGTISKREHEELDNWIAASDENMQLFERLTDEKNLEEAAKWIENVDTEKALEEKKQQIEFNKPPVRKMWLRILPYAVAASVIIVLGLLFFQPSESNGTNGKTVVINDINPGGNKAVLQLADGRKIILDSAANGVLATEGNIPVSKIEGQLIYTKDKAASSEIIYNAVTTPKGGQYKLTLSDGTKVWLNAASSIQYPVSFSSNERTVSIKGEAYFEVEKNKEKPFKVKVNDMMVEVLGTQFNINAYSDEPAIRTTLAEGSIKVSILNGESSTLKPGQQAQLTSEGVLKTVDANIEEILAWKDGKFSFDGTQIEHIMRQITRWYDAEVIYELKPTDHFTALDVPRDVPVSKLLYFLEKTGRVHFKIENNKIIVKK